MYTTTLEHNILVILKNIPNMIPTVWPQYSPAFYNVVMDPNKRVFSQAKGVPLTPGQVLLGYSKKSNIDATMYDAGGYCSGKADYVVLRYNHLGLDTIGTSSAYTFDTQNLSFDILGYTNKPF